jgi:hypothetical protein
MPQITDKTKKAGGHLGGRPLLGTGMFIPRRSGHLAQVMIDWPRRTFRFRSELEYLCHAFQAYSTHAKYSSPLTYFFTRAITLAEEEGIPSVALTDSR